MDNILPTISTRRRRVGRKRRQGPSSSASPAGPVLVSATYVSTESLTLTFDRAIDIDGIVPGDVFIDDGGTDVQYGGTADVTLIGPATVRIVLIENTEFV